jgi:hypothetical protein
MLGVELVTDRQKKTPAKVEISHAMDLMKGNPWIVLRGHDSKLLAKLKQLDNLFHCYYRYGSVGRKRWLLWKCFQNNSSSMLHKAGCR